MKNGKSKSNDSKQLTPSRKLSYDNVAPTKKGAMARRDQDEEISVSDEGRGGYANMTNNPQLTSDDLLMPRLRLGQGQTPEVQSGEAQIGDVIVLGCNPVKEAVVVPLVFGKGRQYRDEEDRMNILCSSRDAEIGEGNPGVPGFQPPYHCAECPRSKWTEKKTKRGEIVRMPPDCEFFYSYIAWSETHKTLVQLEYRKSSINSAKQINTMIMQRGLGNFAIKIRSQKTANAANQQYVVPVITPQKVDDKVLETAKAAL